MKTVPLAVTIPCILELVVSGLAVAAVLVFMGTGRFPSTPELMLFGLAAINGFAAYRCFKGSSLARYILVGMKAFVFLYAPVAVLIVLLWGYLLILHRPSREFFSNPPQVQLLE